MGNNEVEKVKLRRDSVKVQEQLMQELTRKNVELKSYELEKFKGFTDGMTSSFSSSLSSMLRGEKSFADACFDILDSVVDNFIQQSVNMASEWVKDNLLKVAYNNIFAASTTATNAEIAASNSVVAASNTATAGSAGVLSAANTALTASNTTVAASAGAAAATTATSAGVMTGAAATMGSGITALVAPITTLSTTMGMLALSTSAVAANMAIIALSTGLFAVEALLANLSAMLFNVQMLAMATAATVASKAVAMLAIANAANSAAMIPFIGWMLAPGAALQTALGIAIADTLVQFRENGGPVEAGKPYIVGEKRPELFIPDRNGTILPDTSALNGGGETVNQYSISVSMPISATDAKSFEGRIDEMTNRIHQNLSRGIKKRKLTPLGT